MAMVNSPRLNRLKVAMDQSGATPSIQKGVSSRSNDHWAPLWPCTKDHAPDNIIEYADGRLRCRICSAEGRKKNREANKEREKANYRRRYEKRLIERGEDRKYKSKYHPVIS